MVDGAGQQRPVASVLENCGNSSRFGAFRRLISAASADSEDPSAATAQLHPHRTDYLPV